MTTERVFPHNCAECLSRRVMSVERTPSDHGWTTVVAVCADCGGTTCYDTLSPYSYIFAPLATDAEGGK